MFKAKRPDKRPSIATIGAVFLWMILLVTLIDPALSQLMRELDRDILALGRILTETGKSHWYLVPTGIGTIVLWIFSRLSPATPNRQWILYLAGAMLFLFIAVAFSGIVINVIKIIVGRSRPRLLDREDIYDVSPFTLDSDYHSFPSGHANTLIALGLAVSFFVPRWRMSVLSIVSFLALTRIVVNAHYLSDVLGGAVVAVVTTYWLRDIFTRRGFDFLFLQRRRQDTS